MFVEAHRRQSALHRIFWRAKLIKIGDYTIEGNRHCRDTLIAKEPERYAFLDQLHNWDNPLAHFETTEREILSDLMMNLLAYADGAHDLSSIAETIGVPAGELMAVGETLQANNLLEIVRD